MSDIVLWKHSLRHYTEGSKDIRDSAHQYTEEQWCRNTGPGQHSLPPEHCPLGHWQPHRSQRAPGDWSQLEKGKERKGNLHVNAVGPSYMGISDRCRNLGSREGSYCLGAVCLETDGSAVLEPDFFTPSLH